MLTLYVIIGAAFLFMTAGSSFIVRPFRVAVAQLPLQFLFAAIWPATLIAMLWIVVDK